MGDELEGFDCGGAATDYEDVFVFGGLAVELRGVDYGAFELLLAGDVGGFGVAAGSDGGDYAVEAAVGWVVDNPAALIVLIYLFHLCIECCLLVEMVLLPHLGDLVDNLLAVGVAAAPVDGGEEAVHERVDLEARGVVDLGPDAAESFAGAGFEEVDVEAMADTVGCGRDAGQTCSDDCNLRSAQCSAGSGGIRREEEGDEVLDPLVDEVDGVVDEGADGGVDVFEVRVGVGVVAGRLCLLSSHRRRLFVGLSGLFPVMNHGWVVVRGRGRAEGKGGKENERINQASEADD